MSIVLLSIQFEFKQNRGHDSRHKAGSKLGPVASLVIGGDVAVKESIKILGVHLDSTLSMDNQV